MCNPVIGSIQDELKALDNRRTELAMELFQLNLKIYDARSRLEQEVKQYNEKQGEDEC